MFLQSSRWLGWQLFESTDARYLHWLFLVGLVQTKIEDR
jgi:hypothetical protein